MDKIAQLKHAEVAGVISGLIDGGYIKVASDEDFEALTGAVANSISNDWDLNEVLDKTAEVMEYASDDMDKTAEEQVHDALADFGYLVLMKEAEEISDEDFIEKAAKAQDTIAEMIGSALSSANHSGGRGLRKAMVSGKKLWNNLSLKNTRRLVNKLKKAKGEAGTWGPGFGTVAGDAPTTMDIIKSLKNPAKTYGKGIGAGAGLYGLNKLRDKDNRDAIARKFNAGKKAILG
jgi:hypothetical protein